MCVCVWGGGGGGGTGSLVKIEDFEHKLGRILKLC